MKIDYRAVTVSALISMLARSPAAAQPESPQTAGASPAAVSSCSQNSQGVSRSIDAMTTRIEEARQTNDAANMRAAVADLQVALAQIKTQLADCLALSRIGVATPGMAGIDHSKMNMAPATPMAQPGAKTPASAPPDPHAGHTMATMPTVKPAAAAPKTAPKSAARRPAASPEHAGHDMSNMPGMKQAASKSAAEEPKPSAAAGKPVITLESRPTPPRTGDNEFEVTVKGENGEPISDANVSLDFFMPANPSVKMAEMRSSVKLIAAGNGVYRGKASLGMAGQWDATVVITRAGQRLGSKQTIISAR